MQYQIKDFFKKPPAYIAFSHTAASLYAVKRPVDVYVSVKLVLKLRYALLVGGYLILHLAYLPVYPVFGDILI